MPQAMTPDELFELTARSHDLGEHRTGTPADLSTAEWFFGHLADLGASVHRRHVAFDRHDVQAVLVDADGEPIPSEVVYYEFLGHFDGTGLRVARASQRGSGNASAFDPLLVDRDEPLIIVIEGRAARSRRHAESPDRRRQPSACGRRAVRCGRSPRGSNTGRRRPARAG